MFRRGVGLLAALLLLGCSYATLGPEPTLLVRNEALDPVTLRWEDGRRIGSVFPGQTGCFRLSYPEESRQAYFQFGRWAPQWWLPRVEWWSSPAWEVRVGRVPNFDRMTLVPVKERCR